MTERMRATQALITRAVTTLSVRALQVRTPQSNAMQLKTLPLRKMQEKTQKLRALKVKTLATIALTGGLSSPAMALMYNQQGIETTGHWASMTLVLGEERIYRASNGYDMPGTAFSVDFAPPECRPRLELRVDMGEVASRDETVSADAALRVDRFTPHAGPTTLAKERGDNGAYVSFTNAAPFRLLKATGVLHPYVRNEQIPPPQEIVGQPAEDKGALCDRPRRRGRRIRSRRGGWAVGAAKVQQIESAHLTAAQSKSR